MQEKRVGVCIYTKKTTLKRIAPNQFSHNDFFYKNNTCILRRPNVTWLFSEYENVHTVWYMPNHEATILEVVMDMQLVKQINWKQTFCHTCIETDFLKVKLVLSALTGQFQIKAMLMTLFIVIRR